MGADALNHVDWAGKNVVIFGCGAFAIENVRTALEAGAAHVTVVARRLGTICPKIIVYLNFVKPWDAEYRHDTATNVKQLQAWRKLYKESTATTPTSGRARSSTTATPSPSPTSGSSGTTWARCRPWWATSTTSRRGWST